MRFYRFCCVVLAIVLAIVLVLTVLSNQDHYRKADPASVTEANFGYYYVKVDAVRDGQGNTVMEAGYVQIGSYLDVLDQVDPEKAVYYQADFTRLGAIYETYLLFDGFILYALLATVA